MKLKSPVIAFVSPDEVELSADWTIATRAGLLGVTRGAISDGASIPGLLSGLSGYSHFEGDTLPAAFAHDQLYAGELCSRDVADQILFDLLRANGVSWIRASLYFRAVRMFGGLVWEQHTPQTVLEARRHATLQVSPTD